MRLIRVYVDAPLAAGARARLGEEAAAHVRKVLRLKPGDAVTLFNGDGHDYTGHIAEFGRGSADVDVGGRAPARRESPLPITLVQGIARTERMDLVLQKATELGVSAIVPVATARSVVRLDAENRERKGAHWRGIAIAACEQSGRARVPEVAEPLALAAWLGQPLPARTRILLTPGADAALPMAARDARAIELLVGPEGGLTDGEREAAIAAGYRACRLGPRVLRSETAAIAAIAVIQAVAGDLA